MSMATERDLKTAPDSERYPTESGMPFHWAMAFAFLVFLAMCVAFWCGHSFSVSTMEMFTTNRQPIVQPNAK